jgi:hypothetical protein
MKGKKIGFFINLYLIYIRVMTIHLNRHQRAHSPQLAAGLASESKIDKIPYREDTLQLAAGYSSIY